jgi:hypothetical protein
MDYSLAFSRMDYSLYISFNFSISGTLNMFSKGYSNEVKYANVSCLFTRYPYYDIITIFSVPIFALYFVRTPL